MARGDPWQNARRGQRRTAVHGPTSPSSIGRRKGVTDGRVSERLDAAHPDRPCIGPGRVIAALNRDDAATAVLGCATHSGKNNRASDGVARIEERYVTPASVRSVRERASAGAQWLAFAGERYAPVNKRAGGRRAGVIRRRVLRCAAARVASQRECSGERKCGLKSQKASRASHHHTPSEYREMATPVRDGSSPIIDQSSVGVTSMVPQK